MSQEKNTHPTDRLTFEFFSEEAFGFPDFFIEASIEASLLSGAIISFRTGEAPNLHRGHPVSPKPASLKIKTCSIRQGIPLLTGFVPIDQVLFGRIGGMPSPTSDALTSVKNELIGKNQLKEAEKFSRLPLEVTFEDLRSGIRLGRYTLFPVDDVLEFQATGALNNEFVHPEPDRARVLFRIRPKDISAMEASLEYMAVEYRFPETDTFSSLDIFAYEGYPVTGDIDMLAVAAPLSAAEMLGESLLQGFASADLYRAYDAGDFCQLKELVVMYLLIRHAMNGRPISRKNIGEQEIRVIMESAAVQSSGVITPCELLILMLSHEKLSKSYKKIAPGSENLIRHGAETCNPGKLSDMEGPMLHIHNGSVFVTRNQRELVCFYLQSGLLEKHFLIVHPGWDMTLWAPVVERQLALGQASLISHATLERYHQFQKSMQLHESHTGTGEIFSSMGSKVVGFVGQSGSSPVSEKDQTAGTPDAKNDPLIEKENKPTRRLLGG